jgi:uncharacterized protein (DUF952 family)
VRLFHITTRAAWQGAHQVGAYRADSLAEVGYIHLSTATQWRTTLVRFFQGARDLVLLEIESERLAAPVRFERVDGEDFPHLYGPLPVEAVVAVHDPLSAA